MNITKYGHCCLLIEIEGKRILTDPGSFSTEYEHLTAIDIVLITHEHGDHCHTESIAHILDINPQATVVTNSSVQKLLSDLGITATILEGEAQAVVADIALQAFDGKHVEIYEDYGQVQNTGYLIANDFFYPGDAYTVPNVPVKILALPVAGPWCKVSDAISYALAVKPKIAFPVHDATLTEVGKSVTYPHFARALKEKGVEFLILEKGKSTEF